MLHRLHAFVGRQLIDCEDAIEAIAEPNHYSVVVKGHDAPPNLDNDESRLNVRTNEKHAVIGFSIG